MRNTSFYLCFSGVVFAKKLTLRLLFPGNGRNLAVVEVGLARFLPWSHLNTLIQRNTSFNSIQVKIMYSMHQLIPIDSTKVNTF
jgi:hypothetical protein